MESAYNKNGKFKEVRTMNNNQIAKILYGMYLGLDYGDGIEYAEDEISCIADELEGIGDSLRQALENIAEQNREAECFVDRLIQEHKESM